MPARPPTAGKPQAGMLGDGLLKILDVGFSNADQTTGAG